ncbi:MAG: hypothetical protein K2L70_06610 [Clostridia bacterium]|nr:hypothetical protein [Clostridia bacterium]
MAKSIIKRGLTFDYKSKIYKIFTALFNYAVKHNYVDSNIVSRVGNFKNTDAKKEMIFGRKTSSRRFITLLTIFIGVRSSLSYTLPAAHLERYRLYN